MPRSGLATDDAGGETEKDARQRHSGGWLVEAPLTDRPDRRPGDGRCGVELDKVLVEGAAPARAARPVAADRGEVLVRPVGLLGCDLPKLWRLIASARVVRALDVLGGGEGGAQRGPELYGVEPASFYFRNLALNLNLVLPLALAFPALVRNSE